MVARVDVLIAALLTAISLHLLGLQSQRAAQ